MRLKLTRGNALKIKTSTRLPAQVAANSPITLNSSNGTRTFGLDITALRTSLDSVYATTPISSANLPFPTSTTLGGVKSFAAQANKWINTVSTAGAPSATQPSFTDLSGNIAVAQMNSGTSASSSTYWRGDGTWAAGAAGTTLGKSITGLLPSNNVTTPLTKLDISAGSARSSDLTTDMILSSGITKIEGAWAVGTGNGGLDSGTTFANNTNYHIHLIYHPTGPVVDVLFSTSATAPTLPGGYTKKRRIGCFQTDSAGDIVKAQWRADGSVQYVLQMPILNRSMQLISLLTLAPTTPAAGVAGTVPIGIKVKIRAQVVLFNNGGADIAFYGIVRDPDTGAPANDALLGQFGLAYRAIGATLVTMVEDFTSTAGQVYTASYPSGANNVAHLYIQGYTDLRDEYA